MKRYILDTYRLFLLQMQKIGWDFFAISVIAYATFVNIPYIFDFSQGIIPLCGMWLALRLFWIPNKKKVVEYEAIRPCMIGSGNVSRLLVLCVFFSLVPVIIMYLYYDFRFIKFAIYLNNTGYLPSGFEPTVIKWQEITKVRMSNLSTHLFLRSEIIALLRYYWVSVLIAIAFARTNWYVRVPVIIIVCFWACWFLIDSKNMTAIRPFQIPSLVQLYIIPVLLIVALWPTRIYKH